MGVGVTSLLWVTGAERDFVPLDLWYPQKTYQKHTDKAIAACHAAGNKLGKLFLDTGGRCYRHTTSDVEWAVGIWYICRL